MTCCKIFVAVFLAGGFWRVFLVGVGDGGFFAGCVTYFFIIDHLNRTAQSCLYEKA